MAEPKELSHIVAHIAFVFFAGFILALAAALLLPWLKLVPVASPALFSILRVFGFGSLFFGTIVVFFAQKYRRPLYKKDTDKVCFDFYVGPYKYMRHPTYLGLLILMIGLACILNSLPVLVVTGITIFFAHFTLVKDEEKLLTGECGEAYQTYKAKVRM